MAKNKNKPNPREGIVMPQTEKEQVEVEGTENIPETVNATEADAAVVDSEKVDLVAETQELEKTELVDQDEAIDAPEESEAKSEETPPAEEIKDTEEDGEEDGEEEQTIKYNPAELVLETFDKKTINDIISNYIDIEVSEEDVSIYNTVENKKARALIKALSEAAAREVKHNDMVIKTLAHLSIFMLDTKKEKDSGLLFQLLVQDFNNAKDVAEIDMSIYILTRLFKHVRSFSFTVILKGINSGYHPEFKVNVLQMHEVFSQLSTRAERDLKIDKTISFANKKDGRGKAFNVSNVFLNQNGSKLLTQYFTDK